MRVARRVLGWLGLTAALLGAVLLPFLAAGDATEAALDAMLAEPAGRAAVTLLIVGALALDMLLPVPSSVVATASGATLGWLGGAAASCAGLTLGCWIGYRLGRAAGPAATRLIGSAGARRLEDLLERYGPLAVIAVRAVPVLAEASILLAGIGRMPQAAVLRAALLANAGLSLIYAGLGAWAVDAGAFMLAFAGSLLLPCLAYALAAGLRAPFPRR